MIQSALKPLSLALLTALALTACSQDAAPPVAAEPAVAPAAAPAPEKLTIDTASLPQLPAFKVSDLDESISACTDLNAHVNRKWLAANPVPADRTTWGSFEMLGERSLGVQKQIVETLAVKKDVAGVEKVIGDFWSTGMDEAKIEAAGIAPIQPLLDQVAALATPKGRRKYIRESHAEGRGALFGFGGESDFKDSAKVIAYVTQGGLGLPDEDYFADHVHEPNARPIAPIWNAPATGWRRRRPTQAQPPTVINRNQPGRGAVREREMSPRRGQFNNPMSIADADAKTPMIDWADFFTPMAWPRPSRSWCAIRRSSKRTNGVLKPRDQCWQAYLRFHTADSAAPYLTNALVDQTRVLRHDPARRAGTAAPLEARARPGRWHRGRSGSAMPCRVRSSRNPSADGKAGRQPVDRAQWPTAKIAWMSQATKSAALEKWPGLTSKVGYPTSAATDGAELHPRRSFANVLAVAKLQPRIRAGPDGQAKDDPNGA